MSILDRMYEEKNWYVLHTYSGYEKKVQQNLASRMKSMGMEENIFEILVPEQEVYEEKNGEFAKAQSEIIRLETALAIGVKKKKKKGI